MSINVFSTRELLSGQLMTGNVVSQSFVADGEVLTSFGVEFGTYTSKNICVAFRVLILANDKLLWSDEFDGQDIIDNAWKSFFPKLPTSHGQLYSLVLECISAKLGKSVTVKFGKHHSIAQSDLIFSVNGSIKDAHLCSYFAYDGATLSNDSSDCPPAKSKPNKTVQPPLTTSYVSGKISVVIPCWNTANLVEKTIESLLSQVYNNIEIIIADDFSDDFVELMQIAKKYNIQYVCLSKHSGAPAARNCGSKLCTGEYVYFCDSDVELDPTCFIKLIQALHSNRNASWAYSNFKIGDIQHNFRAFDKKIYYRFNQSSTMSLILYKDFPGWDESLKRFQDWDVFLTMIEANCIGVWVDDVLFTALERPGITNNSISWDEGVEELMRKHRNRK